MFVVCVAYHVHSHVFDDGHVLGSAACSQARQVVVKDDVEHPMEAIFDAPMASHGCCEGLGIELCRGKVEAPFLLNTTAAIGPGLDHGNHGQLGKAGLVGVAPIREQPIDIVADKVAPLFEPPRVCRRLQLPNRMEPL